MELIRGIHNIRDRHRGCVLTIGAFDGVHRGHQAVLKHVLKVAAEKNLPSTVVTLEPLPREYFAPLKAPARLMSFREKYEALSALGVDRLLLIPFNEKIQRMEAAPFITTVFVDKLGAKHVVVGDDVRFGHDGAGDFGLLQQLGRDHDFGVEDTASLKLDDLRVSSTRIRELLEAGNFDDAEQLLGRPYSISGKVVYGQQLGRSLGSPTANLELHRLRAAMSGVYAVRVQVGEEQQLRPAVANVGTRPTVDNLVKAILEVHLLDFDKDLYGQRLKVEFREKIREEEKFESLDALKEQIGRDIETARSLLTA